MFRNCGRRNGFRLALLQIKSLILRLILPSKESRYGIYINAAQREKEVPLNRAEANRIAYIEAQAAADAKNTSAEGEGQAKLSSRNR